MVGCLPSKAEVGLIGFPVRGFFFFLRGLMRGFSEGVASTLHGRRKPGLLFEA
jgi:hypothetical protein